MSYGTAFLLSLKNLWSKKVKTIIESLAGSIGIIGIALVLAVSSGFTNYINHLQANTLGGYPVTIGMVSADMEAVMNGGITDETCIARLKGELIATMRFNKTKDEL